MGCKLKLEVFVWPLQFLFCFMALLGSFIRPDFNLFLSFVAYFVIKTANPVQFFQLALFYAISSISDIVWLSTHHDIQHWTYAEKAHEFALTCSIFVFILKLILAVIFLLLSRNWNHTFKVYFQG
mmetsp:Transcript_42086/g.67674  ORF Transcript_42086/g.67674 Transcript_42086/m.67674 type:complete len:125 (+) Transcript_42086:139-513(+)